MPRKVFKFEIWYFKSSGKFYTETVEDWEVSVTDSGGPYMADAVAKMRGLIESGRQGSMPGLSVQSAGWDGHILINCEEGFPCLIPNCKRDDGGSNA